MPTQPSSKNDPVLRRFLQNPATTVFLLSAGGYWITYSFEIGYLSAFGLSFQFAQVQLTSFLFAGLGGLSAGLALIGLMDSIIGINKRLGTANPIHRKLRRVFLVGGAISVPFISYTILFQNYSLLFLVFFYPAYELAWPLLAHPGTKGYANKVLKEEAANKPKVANHPTIFWASRFVIYASMFALVAYAVGVLLANNQTNFSVIKDNSGSRYVLLRQYGDTFITAKLGKENKIDYEYRYIVASGGNTLDFTREKFKHPIVGR